MELEIFPWKVVMNRSFILHFILTGALLLSAGRVFGAPMPQQQRIPQAVIVDGQQVRGVTIVQNGLARSFSCSNPQPYMTMDGSSSGWACFDANTGSWLLNAVPPASANVYAEPPYDYEAPYYPYDYGYPDYSYAPYGFLGPAFSFGFGFGGGYDHDRHEHYEHRSEHGGHGHVEGGGGHGHGGHGGGHHR